jgi:hypothetical protein
MVLPCEVSFIAGDSKWLKRLWELRFDENNQLYPNLLQYLSGKYYGG